MSGYHFWPLGGAKRELEAAQARIASLESTIHVLLLALNGRKDPTAAKREALATLERGKNAR
jgi:hypothetical protein